MRNVSLLDERLSAVAFTDYSPLNVVSDLTYDSTSFTHAPSAWLFLHHGSFLASAVGTVCAGVDMGPGAL
jgi:hypothetical protein